MGLKAPAHAAALITKGILRIMGRGATTLPGKVAIKMCPDIINKCARGKKIITITGTNGKTTTTHMITSMLRSLGYEVVTNVSGANLASGITTTFLCEKPSRGADPDKTVYVLETDEAAFARIAKDLQPKVCVVTNLFRDQLDRYGELTHTRDLIAKGIDATSAKIVLNADDSLVASMGKTRAERSSYFGISLKTMLENNHLHPNNTILEASSDAAFCPECKVRYNYNARSFGHLGDYKCPSCGFSTPAKRFELSYDASGNPSDIGFPFDINDTKNDKSCELNLKIAGSHNLYNTCAAVSAVTTFLENDREEEAEIFENVCKAQENVEAAFGRMEKIAVGNKYICILLVKNPVGLDRSLSFVAQSSDADSLMLVLNSNTADGKDVSWIWDVDFESKVDDLPQNIYVSGERYGDMMLRVAYSGRTVDGYGTLEYATTLLKGALADCPDGKCIYILPNYTAMLDLRGRLVKELKLKDFWKD
jgi:UDP-N-acetylmuramyl tripeptide synthase